MLFLSGFKWVIVFGFIRLATARVYQRSWHGPYHIVQFLSPVHCILCTLENRRISTTVHVSRLKHYYSPDTQPIRQPTELVWAYLQGGDLPADSFLQPDTQIPASDSEETASDTAEPETCNNQPTVPTETPSQNAPLTRCRTTEIRAQASADLTNASHNWPFPNIHWKWHLYCRELLKQCTKNGQQQFLVKWRGFPVSQNSWEPAINILDKHLIEKFYKYHPLASRPDDPDYQPESRPWLSVMPLPTLRLLPLCFAMRPNLFLRWSRPLTHTRITDQMTRHLSLPYTKFLPLLSRPGKPGLELCCWFSLSIKYVLLRVLNIIFDELSCTCHRASFPRD